MAKVSPVSIKYMVKASFTAQGPLEKSDVIGALFGQTEGLLGEALEMRELQKEGKIGRIEVELETVDGKSVGEIFLPSALDKSETTIVAAALETIDRVGPTEAEIKVTKIEDVRGEKRDYILDRAKKLLEGLDGGSEFGEMSQSVKEEARVQKIQDYGDEKLPAGDLSGDEVIVVEGRADVVNLLKNRVNNVIGMDGAKLPKEIAKLGEEKELTLFVDGDRGGALITKNVLANAKVKYVAQAPDGKEVEELTGKEILLSLRRKTEVGKGYDDTASSAEITFDGNVKAKLRAKFSDIKGSGEALLLDGAMDVIKKVGHREVTRSVRNSRTGIAAVVLDGNALGAIIKACDEKGVAYLGATNFAAVSGAKVELVSL